MRYSAPTAMTDTGQTISRAAAALLLAACAVLWAAGCLTADEAFTGGRIQNLCAESLTICDGSAGCALDNDHYLEGNFPGTVRVIVNAKVAGGRLSVRLRLTEMRYPGTEMVVQAYEPGCGDLSEERLKDVDLFDLAGDEGVLQFDLALKGAGDHLLEVFSDMSAGFLLTVEMVEAL